MNGIFDISYSPKLPAAETVEGVEKVGRKAGGGVGVALEGFLPSKVQLETPLV